jgi:hypothetical protein
MTTTTITPTTRRTGLSWRLRVLAVGLVAMFAFAGAPMPDARADDLIARASACAPNGYWKRYCIERVGSWCLRERTYWYQCQMTKGGPWYGGTHLPKIVL